MAVSNKHLSILASSVIIISLIGIFSLPETRLAILGAVTNTTTGIANVSIAGETQIRLNNATVDFGVGFVNSSDVRCVLESNSSNRMNSTGGTAIHPCDKVGGGPGFNAPAITPNFVIENTGNVNITLRINSSFHGGAYWGNGTAGMTPGFLCDPRTLNPPQNCTLARAEYNWSAEAMESNTCKSDANPLCSGCMRSRNRFNDSLNGSQKIVCMNMDYISTKNEIRVSMRLGIPRDSRMGLLNDTILFQADTG